MFCKKMSQVDTENDKTPKTFQLSKFSCIFFEVFTDFLDWNVLNCQQGENSLSSSL